MIWFKGPPGYELADWRRRISDLYSEVRKIKDPEAAWKLWLEKRSELFQYHPMSPLPKEERKQFKGIGCFDYDPALRFEVQLTSVETRSIDVDLGADGKMSYKAVGRTEGLTDRLGSELTVYWINSYGGGLFLPFRDATNTRTTYGGGRYILDAIKGADLGLGPSGGLILDFNFSYNPSCALNSEYVCPLPPVDNTLPEAVTAGEIYPVK